MALTPGERIDLKKKISETLGQQDWKDIDLTLGEFDFATTDHWNGSNRGEYVLDMLQAGSSDEGLTQLDSYLHPAHTPTAPPQPQAFNDPSNPWSGEGFRLFISHRSDYAEDAGALREELSKRSIDAFVAHDSIEPTEEWQDVILFALRSCDACLALLTPGFPASPWTDQEVGWCMARDRLVVPVEFGLNPYGFLGKYQALSVKKGHDQADIALGVFELLARKRQSRDAMARALVSRWENTGSWDAARENYSFLKKVPEEAWTQQLVNDVWSARERNHQLKTANINWKDSDKALEALLVSLPFTRPSPGADEDDIPF
jgi:hypothetical protein